MSPIRIGFQSVPLPFASGAFARSTRHGGDTDMSLCLEITSEAGTASREASSGPTAIQSKGVSLSGIMLRNAAAAIRLGSSVAFGACQSPSSLKLKYRSAMRNYFSFRF